MSRFDAPDSNVYLDPFPVRTRRGPPPPPSEQILVSRREAATLLGFASEFNVRRLEREGRLRAQRGALGTAWYSRDEILALRTEINQRSGMARRGSPDDLPDEALLALLARPKLGADGAARARTPVDLVLEAGVSMARAEDVWEFWVRHGRAFGSIGAEPAATSGVPAKAPEPVKPSVRPEQPAQEAVVAAQPVAAPTAIPAPVAAAPEPALAVPAALRLRRPAAPQARPSSAAAESPSDRRSPARLKREDLLVRLRDPKPSVRAAAFEALKRIGPA